MPKTRFYLRQGEDDGAEWASKNLGKIEVERISESWTNGSGKRTRTETLQKSIEPLVMAGELITLPDLHGYLQYEGHAVPLSVPRITLAERTRPFIERKLPSNQFTEKAKLLKEVDQKTLPQFR